MTPKFVSLVLLAALALMAAPSAEAETAAVGAGPGRLLFASTRTADGNSEIYSADIAGEQATNLTADPAPDIAPAWSPDGRQIAFASRRDQNWDLYLMQSDGTGLRRLTDSQAYDSDPAWSPDGEQIAFSSTRSGNLDIYLLDLASGDSVQLTDHPDQDYGPTWSPDGRQIAFTSWRDGQQEIYALDLVGAGGGEGYPPARNLSQSESPDYDPAWSPDGRRLAYIADGESIGSLMVYDFVTGTTAQAGPSGRTLTDPSWAPTGGLLASGVWLAGGQRFSQRQGVLITRAGVAGATYLVGSSHTYSDPSWNAHALAPATIDERIEPGRLLAPVAPATPPERAEGLVALQGVRSGGRQALAADVYPSFAALRQAVIAVSGHDFLSHLSEATRPVDFNSSSASYTSWHKAGRAFDTLFSYSAGGRQVLYISPDPVGGRLLWRLYLYTARQDGSQGAPITAAVFNPSSRTLLPPPEGYFVDFTDLALQHGWRRIAAQERDNFNWQSDLLALEYWHFERRDGLSWYAAMALIYDERTLERLFNVDAILAAGSRPSSNLGLPWAPPSLQAAGLLLNRAGPR